MAITVNSPHSGKPVKVRDQDVGRAVRDEQGRIFYVLSKSDGSGYVGSRTRRLSDKPTPRPTGDTHDANALDADTRDQVERTSEVAPAPAHDATGVRRRSWRGVLVILVLGAILALMVYLFSPWGPYGWDNVERGRTPQPNPIPVRAAPVSPLGTEA